MGGWLWGAAPDDCFPDVGADVKSRQGTPTGAQSADCVDGNQSYPGHAELCNAVQPPGRFQLHQKKFKCTHISASLTLRIEINDLNGFDNNKTLLIIICAYNNNDYTY